MIFQLSFLFLMSLFLSACSNLDSVQVFDQQQAAILLHQQHAMHPARQMIKLSLPNKSDWKKIDLSYGTLGTPAMLIPINESRTDWTQSIRTQIRGHRHDPSVTAASLVKEMIAHAKTQCASAEGVILHTQPLFINYKLSLAGCKEEPDQIQYGKALNGHDAVYVVYYTAINHRVKFEQIQKMSKVIQGARLVRNNDF